MYVPLAWWKPSFPWIVTAVVIEQFTGGLGSTAHVVYLMRRCRRAFSASHYAFASSVVALGTMITGAFSGHLDARLGHFWYFVACVGFFVPSLVLVLVVPKTALDASDPPPPT
jgi:PAT family beta-lactamase induction signal transducer AmpG